MVKFKIKKAGKKFFALIESANGRYPLASIGAKKEKSTVKNAIGKMIAHIQAGEYEIIDLTKAKSK